MAIKLSIRRCSNWLTFIRWCSSRQWPTLPQLYVKGEFVGGCDIVSDMHKSGELAELLADFVKK